MPRDFRHSYSRSPRRSRTRSPRHSDRYNGAYRDERRGVGGGGGGGGGIDDSRYERYERRRRSSSRGYGSNGSDRYSQRDRSDRDYDRGHREQSFEDEIDQCRIHIADLTNSVTQYDIEKVFMKYGEIKEVWMAKNPPCFAFVVFKNKEDAAEACKDMDQKVIGYNRCRVTFARPRTRGRKRRWDPNMRCYQCGERGHFSRDCDGGASKRRHERSYSRGRNARRSRSRSYSRGRRSNSITPRNYA